MLERNPCLQRLVGKPQVCSMPPQTYLLLLRLAWVRPDNSIQFRGIQLPVHLKPKAQWKSRDQWARLTSTCSQMKTPSLSLHPFLTKKPLTREVLCSRALLTALNPELWTYTTKGRTFTTKGKPCSPQWTMRLRH